MGEHPLLCFDAIPTEGGLGESKKESSKEFSFNPVWSFTISYLRVSLLVALADYILL